MSLVLGCNSHAQDKKKETSYEVTKTETEWRAQLTDLQFYVLREAGTERPFTSALNDNKESGVYHCAGCNTPLFKSEHKFDSGTGWPSFFEPAVKGHIKEDTDYKIGYPRTEILCARCDGHLGHVFNDGPRPTGLRYCVNSVSLDFVESKKNE